MSPWGNWRVDGRVYLHGEICLASSVFLLLCRQEAPDFHVHLLINSLLLPSAVHYHFVGYQCFLAMAIPYGLNCVPSSPPNYMLYP